MMAEDSEPVLSKRSAPKANARPTTAPQLTVNARTGRGGGGGDEAEVEGAHQDEEDPEPPKKKRKKAAAVQDAASIRFLSRYLI